MGLKLNVRNFVLLFLLGLFGHTAVVETQSETVPREADIILLVSTGDLRRNASFSEESPAIIYLVETSFPKDASVLASSSRVTRGMSLSAKEETSKHSRITLFDLLVASMRKSKDNPLPMSLLPPPEEEPLEEPPEESDPANQDLENEGNLHAVDPPDPPNLPFLFTDFAGFLMQPLRPLKKPKDKGEQDPAKEMHTERDGRYESAMVATMPHRRCPPGLKQDSMRHCRPMFRNRRGYNLRRIRIRPSAKGKDINTQD